MLMLFILHSATTNSVWYSLPRERPQRSSLERQYERLSVFFPVKWRVHCLVSVIPSPSGSQLLDLHCQGILPRALPEWVLSQQHPRLPSNSAPWGWTAFLPTPLQPSSLTPVSHKCDSFTYIMTHEKTCSFAACLYKCPDSVYHHHHHFNSYSPSPERLLPSAASI